MELRGSCSSSGEVGRFKQVMKSPSEISIVGVDSLVSSSSPSTVPIGTVVKSQTVPWYSPVAA